MRSSSYVRCFIAAFIATVAVSAYAQAVPSWNDGRAKRAIVEFVTDVTTQGRPNFVAPEDRIAVFDNDGTLWAEQPMYFQLAFMLDQLKAAAPKRSASSRTTVNRRSESSTRHGTTP